MAETRRFTCWFGDGAPEAIDLDAFIATNTAPDVEPLTAEEIEALRSLAPGESVMLGGGAGETVTVRRVS